MCVQGVVLQGTPSKVVLLRNMVAPGEVDEHLEDEIAEELGNFGGVQRVLIFEVTDAGFDPKQAVRRPLPDGACQMLCLIFGPRSDPEQARHAGSDFRGDGPHRVGNQGNRQFTGPILWR